MGSIVKHRSCILVAIVLLTALMAGCGDSQDTTEKAAEAVAETAADESAAAEVVASLSEAEEALVAKMATIATALEEAPATANVIMEQHSMTIDEYEAEIYRIASDPALSAAFEKAKNK